jgi:hypothetical protein
VYEALMKVDDEVNRSIRKLFLTLRNDAEKAGVEQSIQYNEELIQENEKKIAELPNKKKRFEEGFYNKHAHQQKVLENKKEFITKQLDAIKRGMTIEQWKQSDEWRLLAKEELNLNLKSVDFEIETLNLNKEFIMKEEKTGENYDVVRVRLEQQNERLKSEIDRFKGIIENCKKLELIEEDE